MKATFVICCVLVLALSGLSCPLKTGPGIPATEGEPKVSVVEVDNGVEITNVSELACIVFVRSPEGEQRFELAAGESVTVTVIDVPVRVSAVAA